MKNNREVIEEMQREGNLVTKSISLPKRIIRVFPRRTNATPADANVRIRTFPNLFDEADEVHISVAFTWDMQWAEFAAKQWTTVAPVKFGGPAYNEAGSDFVPGLYMKRGYVITSRGCLNNCWFCSVPKREGKTLRELPITDGWIVTDDNLLACSEKHINGVFEMLKRQKERPQFVGGLEARLLTAGMAARLKALNPKTMYFAYDTPDDYEPLMQAGKYLRNAGFTGKSHELMCYVLIGYPRDTFESAEKRLTDTIRAGFMPMAMLYRDKSGKNPKDWKRLQELWANKSTVGAKMKEARYE
jgi:hypothetical protein